MPEILPDFGSSGRTENWNGKRPAVLSDKKRGTFPIRYYKYPVVSLKIIPINETKKYRKTVCVSLLQRIRRK